MVAVTLVLFIKFFRGTLNKWLVPLNPDGKDLIKRIQYLEFIADTRYQNNTNKVNEELSKKVVETLTIKEVA
jgi:hypothetical protein